MRTVILCTRFVVAVICFIGHTTAALAGFFGTDVFLPSVGAKAGVPPSIWYTTVWVYNPNATAANVTFYLLERQANLAPLTYTDVIQPGDTAKYENAIQLMFAKQTFGALRLTSNVKVMVGSRIYSQSGELKDSVGQFFAGTPASFAIGAGQSTELVGVFGTLPSVDSTFRYNFGFVETTGTATCDVKVTVKDKTGQKLGDKTYTVRQWEQMQKTFSTEFPTVSTENARLTVEVTSGAGKLIAFGSSAANGSQDPATFEMAFRDELLAGNASGGGLTLPFEGEGSSDNILFWIVNQGKGAGVAGVSLDGPGVYAASNSNTAVWATSKKGHGMFAVSDTGEGVVGRSKSGNGVYGSSDTDAGIFGISESVKGVSGISNSGSGVAGSSSSAIGVLGESVSNWGIKGISKNNGNWGVVGTPNEGVAGIGVGNHNGIYGSATNGAAGVFNGGVLIFGSLAKSSGSFKIDHPLDPTGKYLYHSFVESPDMMNIYNGNVVTDGKGFARVTLPDWFEVLNRDFRYQLTVIGGGDEWAQARVSSKIAGNTFVIQTSIPKTEVSWQVTGIRQDAWANAHRVQVEEDKPGKERGTYIHPEVFGQPEEKGIEWVNHPELMRKLKAERSQSGPANPE